MTLKNSLLPFLCTIILLAACNRDDRYPFRDPNLDFTTRVNDLVSRMTLEEKVGQLVYDAPAIERLGIPAYNWWNECLHGVARAGKATVFPQAIGLAAMFDTAQMFHVAQVISDEARAKYHEFLRKGKQGIYQGLTFWSPNINIYRDPRWGRGQETYGEDPYLTGRMAVSFIRGLQGNHPKYLKLVATAKHYVVHSGPEPDRHAFDAVTNTRDFRDTYLPAFRTAVTEGKAYSVMCAYNRYMGEPCCGSDWLLNQVLRNEMGFEGYIVSDCWAILDFFEGHRVVETMEEASALAVKSGTDLNCGISFPSLIKAVESGLISEKEIDMAVGRLMMARMKLGQFDPDERVPFSKIPYETVNSKKHQRIAYETTLKSVVLLKNKDNLLPLPKSLKTVAVIGPNANDTEVLLGNYNGTPFEPVTPLAGIRQKLGKSAEVIHAVGCEYAANMPVMQAIPGRVLFTGPGPEQKGLVAEFFNNTDFSGMPVATAVHDSIDFNWWEGKPLEELKDDSFAIRWTGSLVPEESGRYALGAEAKDFKLFLNDSLVAKYRSVHHALKRYSFVDLEKGKHYSIRLEFTDLYGDAVCRLLWNTPGTNLLNEALDAAQRAEVSILFMGLTPRLEGEEMRVNVQGFSGGDRISLDLPEVQKDLIRKIHALGKPVVLVLMSGGALSVNWENEHIPAILEAWYPGQAAGNAIADILFGDHNPAGRLPVTFYKSTDQLPPFTDYSMINRTYRYMKTEPLYPFGYGLSYTSFQYSNLRLEKDTITAGEKVVVWVDVTNTGNRDGEEVVQLYIRDNKSSVIRPERELQGFSRVSIPAGQTSGIRFLISSSNLEFYSESGNDYIVEPGDFTIMTGPSSSGKELLKTVLTVR